MQRINGSLLYACCVTLGIVCLNMNFNETDCCNQVNPSLLVTNLANFNAYKYIVHTQQKKREKKRNLQVKKQKYLNLESEFYLNIHMNHHSKALLPLYFCTRYPHFYSPKLFHQIELYWIRTQIQWHFRFEFFLCVCALAKIIASVNR